MPRQAGSEILSTLNGWMWRGFWIEVAPDPVETLPGIKNYYTNLTDEVRSHPPGSYRLNRSHLQADIRSDGQGLLGLCYGLDRPGRSQTRNI